MTDYRDHPTLFDQSRDDEQEVDILEYVRTIWARKWSIAGLALLAGAWGAFVAYSTVPIYQSTATLLIEPERKNVINIQDLYDIRQGGKRFMSTQIAILQSRSLVEQVMDRLGMWREKKPAEEANGAVGDTAVADASSAEATIEEDPPVELADPGAVFDAVRGINWRGWFEEKLRELGIAPPEGKKPDPEEVARIAQVNGFKGRLRIHPQENGLISVSYVSPDRLLAAKVANAVAEVYIESEMEARLQATQQASGWLVERIGGLKEKLRQSEQALQDYREQEELYAVGDATSPYQQNLQNLNVDLAAAEKSRSDLRLAMDQVQAAADLPLERMSSIPAVMGDELFASLRQKEAEAARNVEELSRRYGPKHPSMMRARSDLEVAQENTRKRLELIVDGLSEEYKIANAKVGAVRRQLSSVDDKIRSIARKGHELMMLEREVEINSQLYDQFLSRFKETKEADSLEKVNARIVDRALPSLGPIAPNKNKIIMMAIMVGIAIGVGLAFLLKFLDKTLRRPADFEDKLGIPSMGAIPQLKLNTRKKETPIDYVRNNRKSFFAESVRTLRTGVMLSNLDNPKKIIVVTSTIPGEGKSTVAMNLAHSLSEMDKGKVLLIDADMRRPTIAKNWGLAKDALGLSEFVSQSAKLAECLHNIDDSRVYVMPSGTIPPNPLELLSSKRFAACLESLSDKFGFIIIDSAPTMAVSDALVLSTYASGVVYVVKAMTTPYPLAREGIKRLNKAKAHIIGGVLNSLPMQGGKRNYYYGKYRYLGYYQSEYYGAYGYTDDKGARAA